MPHDPLVKMFVDKVAGHLPLKFWELPLPAARLTFASLAALAGPKNVPIGKVENLVMPGPGGKLHLRLYTPVAAGGEALPGLVFYHGGGFAFGNLDIYDGICRMLAGGTGARVVAVDYRLAPEHPFPAGVEDAYAALCWVEENAARLGIDANRIAVGGDSGGGNFAAVVCQRAKKEGGPPAVCQLMFSPMTVVAADFPSRAAHQTDLILSREAADWFLSNYLPDGFDPKDLRHSPLLAADFSDLPPAYIVIAGDDPLHDEGLAYAQKLRAAGVAAIVDDYPGMMHDFVFLQSILPQAHEALTKAARGVRAMLEG
jgi:acetyl esterase